MNRHRSALLGALTALCCCAVVNTTAFAGAINSTDATTYRLTNSTGGALSKVVAGIIPPGSIVPTDPSVSPLTILDGSTGFDQNALKVLLGPGTSPDGRPVQGLGLDFGTNGLQAGGILNFALSLDKTFTGNLEFVPVTPATGLSIVAVPPAENPSDDRPGGISPPGRDPSPAVNTPEPLSLVLWSALAGLGLVRAGASRRTRLARV